MAEGNTMESSCSESSNVSASDTVFRYQCNPCQYDGEVSDAIRYCLVCKDYLCEYCLPRHNRPKHFRLHSMLTGSALQLAENQGREPDDFCRHHADMKLDYYCQSHATVLCGVCKSTAHGKCTGILPISDACTGIEDGNAVDHFYKRIQSLIRKSEDLQTNRKEELTTIDQQKEAALEEVTKLRKIVDSRLDKLEDEVRQNIHYAAIVQTSQISDHLSILASTTQSLHNAEKHLQDAIVRGEKLQIFISLKKRDLQQLDEALSGMGRVHARIHFQRSKQLAELLSYKKAFGTLDTGLTKAVSYQPLPGELLDMKVFKTGEKNLKEERAYQHTAWITGAIFLPDNSCLLCDYGNNKLKHLDTDLELKSSLKLSYYPWDVAMLNTTEVVVSLPTLKEINVVKVVPRMKKLRSIQVDRKCWGLAVSNDQILVSCHNDPGQGEVVILALDGAVLRRIGQNKDGSYMFCQPYYLALNKEEDKIYVSEANGVNPEMSNVTCITRANGDIVFTCRDPELHAPWGLVVDTSGRVAVCDAESHKLVVLTPDGRKEKTILSLPDDEKPFTFSYRDSDRTLLVGLCHSERLVVFGVQ